MKERQTNVLSILFSFFEKGLYICVRIIFSTNKNGEEKMTRIKNLERKINQKEYRKKLMEQKFKLALLAGTFR